MPETTTHPLNAVRDATGAPWVVLPTYNERENLERLARAVVVALPEARILIVDDNSPDGTGDLADELARGMPNVHVLHRQTKDGLGAAYRAGFAEALRDSGCTAVIQMDCDFSHDPGDLRRLLEPLTHGTHLVLGSRRVAGGATPGWSLKRRVISRLGGDFARTVLGLPYRDLTGGFKAWDAALLREMPLEAGYASGYGFQIEMTWAAHRRGARIAEIPIVFRDRVLGTSKMSAAIMWEAALTVLRLRWQAATTHTAPSQTSGSAR